MRRLDNGQWTNGQICKRRVQLYEDNGELGLKEGGDSVVRRVS